MTTPYIPKRPAGSDAQSRFMQWVFDMLTSYLRPIQVSGQRTSRTSRGFYSIGGTSTPAATSQAKLYKIKDVWGDYLTCRSFTRSINSETDEIVETDGTTDILIAKEHKHRQSLTSETILGVAHDYTYAAGPTETWGVGESGLFNVTRTSDNGSTTEDQRIVPPWTENELINAIPAQTGVFSYDEEGDPDHLVPLQPINLLIVGRSCQWAKIAE